MYKQNDVLKKMDGIVRRYGKNFVLNGKPFYFAGCNYYNLIFCDKKTIDDAMDEMLNLGIKAIRIWGFNHNDEETALEPLKGEYIEENFKVCDYIMKAASDRNLKIMIVFENFWSDYGGIKKRLEWEGIKNETITDWAQFFVDEGCKQGYKDYMKYFINRINTITGIPYKEDPALFAWEFMNEPRYQDVSDYENESGNTLRKWMDEMGEFVKTLDSEHMLGAGIEGHQKSYGFAKDEGNNFIHIHSCEYVDYCTAHPYPDSEWSGLSTQGAYELVKKFINDAHNVVGKPFIMEEFNTTKFEDYIGYWSAMYKAVEELDAAGDMFWCYMHKVSNGFNMALGDEVLEKVFRPHSKIMDGKDYFLPTVKEYSIDLAGEYRFYVDKNDIGLKENIYQQRFANEGFTMPGTTCENKIGEQLVMDFDFKLTKDNVKRLRPNYNYQGVMWYQREIFIPENLRNKSLILHLERVVFSSMVFINGECAGHQNSLSTPHDYDITQLVHFGEENIINIRIDNRDEQNIFDCTHSFTHETQSIWNGVVGSIRIDVKEKVRIEQVSIYPNLEDKKVDINVVIKNCINYELPSKPLKLHCSLEFVGNVEYFYDKSLYERYKNQKINFDLGEICLKKSLKNCIEEDFCFELPFDEYCTWDEYNPGLYSLVINLYSDDLLQDSYEEKFGMREIKTAGRHILLNGNRIFLRGTTDCCLYPKTGYPPMDKNEYLRIFKIIKNHGMNHVRYHTWTPPKPAFEAADEIGLYIQCEGPMWLDYHLIPVGGAKEHYSYFTKETEQIQTHYQNHPSFIIYSNGNELRGDFKYLERLIKNLKETDKRRLYTLSSNWDRTVNNEDDIYSAMTVDGSFVRCHYFAPEGPKVLDEFILTSTLNYDEAAENRDIPVIAFETGSFQVYPNVNELCKFDGVLRAVNFETIRQDLRLKGLSEEVNNYVKSSGQLCANMYKDEIEAAIRTKDLAGFQLLCLNDFTGQWTATVGILDAFWESKGLISEEEFRQFCNSVVPLIELEKRIFTDGEKIVFNLSVANYLFKDLKDEKIVIKVKYGSEILLTEKISVSEIKRGTKSYIHSGVLEIKPSNINRKLRIEVSMSSGYSNGIDIHVVKNNEQLLATTEGIKVLDTLDKITEENLKRGDTILLLINDKIKSKNIKEANFYPVFWSPILFETEDNNGFYFSYDNYVIKDMGIEGYGDYVLKDILENSKKLIIDPKYKDACVISITPNFFCNINSSILAEFRIENCKILICGLNFIDTKDNIVIQNYGESILKYIYSDKFNPKISITLKELKKLF